MLKTYITLDKAIDNVEYFTTPNKKGKTKLQTCETVTKKQNNKNYLHNTHIILI